MASQGEKQGPPREEGKSETVRASSGAEGHPGRTQVYDSIDDSFNAEVLQKGRTQSNEQAPKLSKESDTSTKDTTGGATPAVDSRNSQEPSGVNQRQGTVPLGEGDDQSCSSNAPTVHMTGPPPPWSMPAHLGMQTMGWNGGFTPGPMPGSPFPPWGMTAPSGGYNDLMAMSQHPPPLQFQQQMAYMQYQLSMMQQQEMSRLAMTVPMSPGMQYQQPMTIPGMSGYPIHPVEPRRPQNPGRSEQQRERVPLGERSSGPSSTHRSERPRSFQPSDDGESESSQGSVGSQGSDSESDSDSGGSQAGSQTTGGSSKRASTVASAFEGGAMVAAMSRQLTICTTP